MAEPEEETGQKPTSNPNPAERKNSLLAYLASILTKVINHYFSEPFSCGPIDGQQIVILNSPPGQLTDAFLNIAAVNYACSDGTPSRLHANSPHVISQYDIACFQATMHGLFPP